ncbi:MAG: bifunctional glutamate N-acetyltransferase/amino-acid acetyltransferase ArgJ [Bacillota bacterium]
MLTAATQPGTGARTGVTSPQGYRAAAVQAGIRKQRPDLALLVSDVAASAAGCFTTNLCAAPCVDWTRGAVRGKVSAILVNSGNANACNGAQGAKDNAAMAAAAAAALGVEASGVAVASTGVIGVPMPMAKVLPGISRLAAALSPEGGAAAATAIMTTDTRPKERSLAINLTQGTVTIGAMAKGSGMVHPNLATMLTFITTDAAVPGPLLQAMLAQAMARTFNMITVDGDTSTNDMVVALANGAAGVAVGPGTEDAAVFAAALESVCLAMAQAIVADGEGAQRTIAVTVSGAADEGTAVIAAKAVARSALVKTAVAGGDANWGRVMAALGASGAGFDPTQVAIGLGPVVVARNGQGVPFAELEAARVLDLTVVPIVISLGDGPGQATAWGCDLTCEYVKINASYRS